MLLSIFFHQNGPCPRHLETSWCDVSGICEDHALRFQFQSSCHRFNHEYRIKYHDFTCVWLTPKPPNDLGPGIPPSDRLLGSIGHLAKLDTSKVGLQHVLRIKHPRVSPEKGWIFRSPRRFIIMKVIQTSNEHEIHYNSKHEKKIRTSNEHKMKHNRGARGSPIARRQEGKTLAILIIIPTFVEDGCRFSMFLKGTYNQEHLWTIKQAYLGIHNSKSPQNSHYSTQSPPSFSTLRCKFMDKPMYITTPLWL